MRNFYKIQKEWFSKRIFNKILENVVVGELKANNFDVNIIERECTLYNIDVNLSLFDNIPVLKISRARIARAALSFTRKSLTIEGFELLGEVKDASYDNLSNDEFNTESFKPISIFDIVKSALESFFSSWKKALDEFKLELKNLNLKLFPGESYSTIISVKRLYVDSSIRGIRKFMLEEVSLKFALSKNLLLQVPLVEGSFGETKLSLVIKNVAMNLNSLIISALAGVVNELSAFKETGRETDIFYDAVNDTEMMNSSVSIIEKVDASSLVEKSKWDYVASSLQFSKSFADIEFKIESIACCYLDKDMEILRLDVGTLDARYLFNVQSSEKVAKASLDEVTLSVRNEVIVCSALLSEPCLNVTFLQTVRPITSSWHIRIESLLVCARFDILFTLCDLFFPIFQELRDAIYEPIAKSVQFDSTKSVMVSGTLTEFRVYVPIPLDGVSYENGLHPKQFVILFKDASVLSIKSIEIGSLCLFVTNETLLKPIRNAYRAEEVICSVAKVSTIHLVTGLIPTVEIVLPVVYFHVYSQVFRDIMMYYGLLQNALLALLLNSPSKKANNEVASGIISFTVSQFEVQFMDSSETGIFALFLLKDLKYKSEPRGGTLTGMVSGFRYLTEANVFHTILASTSKKNSSVPNFIFRSVNSVTISNFVSHEVYLESILVDLSILFPLGVFKKVTGILKAKTSLSSTVSKKFQLDSELSVKMENVEILYDKISLFSRSLLFGYSTFDSKATLSSQVLKFSLNMGGKTDLLEVRSVQIEADACKRQVSSSIGEVILNLGKESLAEGTEQCFEVYRKFMESKKWFQNEETQKFKPKDTGFSQKINDSALEPFDLSKYGSIVFDNQNEFSETWETKSLASEVGLQLLQEEIEAWDKVYTDEDIISTERKHAPNGSWYTGNQPKLIENHLLSVAIDPGDVSSKQGRIFKRRNGIGASTSLSWELNLRDLEKLSLKFRFNESLSLISELTGICIIFVVGKESVVEELLVGILDLHVSVLHHSARKIYLEYCEVEKDPRVTNSNILNFALQRVIEDLDFDRYLLQLALLNLELEADEAVTNILLKEMLDIGASLNLREKFDGLVVVEEEKEIKSFSFSTIILHSWELKLSFFPETFRFEKVKGFEGLELLRLFTYEKMKIRLEKIVESDIIGFHGVLKVIVETYYSDIINEQLYSCLKGVRMGGNNTIIQSIRKVTSESLSNTGISDQAFVTYRLSKRRGIKLLQSTKVTTENSFEYMVRVPITKVVNEQTQSLLIVMRRRIAEAKESYSRKLSDK